MPLEELGEFVREMGFDGIELPVRPGFQVQPDNIAQDLPVAVKTLEKSGVKVFSVAGNVDEVTISVLGEVGIPILRTMARIEADETYRAAEERFKRLYDSLVPALDNSKVTIGLQNHSGPFICHAVGLMRLIESFDPKHVAAVWDPAHCVLQGEPPRMAVDILGSHLCMVNLKNPMWRRRTGSEAENVQWYRYWTNGPQGLLSWPEVASELNNREYRGVVCLCAEYTDKEHTERLIRDDLAYAKRVFQNERVS